MAEPTSHRPLLAIVPARGGSKAVPRKNLRSLAGRPMIAYTLVALAEAEVADRIVLSSDDDEALRWGELHGYETRARPTELASDEATISQVAVHLAAELAWKGDVGVFQPTSPLRSAKSIVEAVAAFRAADVDSLASCVREPHTFWLDDRGDLARAQPLFDERVNRQYARHRVLRETGSIQLVRAEALQAAQHMVTDRHLLFELPGDESLDIDTVDDLVAARRQLEQGTVVFRLRANATVGSGHLYHCLRLADELADQRLRFLLRDCDAFVSDLLAEDGYVFRTETDLAADLQALAGPGPKLVVNDVLDTTEGEVLAQRTADFRVVNVEDLGPGARLADWVVNALYPIEDGAVHVSSGPEYATLRSEFHHVPPREVRADPERVLITFGGTDPSHLASRCARLLVDRIDAEVRVIVGPGAAAEDFPPEAVVKRHVRSMVAEMTAADLIITAAGRTVYEAAAVGTPVVVLAQNAREATHAHLSYKSGVVFLGIGPLVDDEKVASTVGRLLGDFSLRAELSERLRCSVDAGGAARIAHRIRALLRGL